MRNYTGRIPLRNDKWAYIQVDELAAGAKEHLRQIRRRWTAPEYFYHLRPGGHVAALRLHQVNTWYGKVDLSKFFSNVTRNRLTRCLKRVGFSFRDAEEFAVASTVCVDATSRRFALPYGFAQSPLLASLALDQSELGNCLRRLHSEGCTVTDYVDDIIVSGNTELEVAATLSEIRAAARNSSFPINEAKSQGPSPELSAFNINFSAHAMEIEPERYEQMCQDVQTSGIGPISRGILSYVESVSSRQAEQLQADFPHSFPCPQP